MLLIPSLKKETSYREIHSIQNPIDFYMPLKAYKNNMIPIAEVGEKVMKYQLLARSEEPFASKLHAPVSGTILAFFHLNGEPVMHLKNDFLDIETPVYPFEPHKITQEALVKIVLDFGIQGAGGSQFPTQLKYNLKGKKINIIIFNGVECEPYLSADFALMREKTDELLKAAQVIQSVLHPDRIVFVIKRQNIAIREVLLENACRLRLEIEVKVLPDTYPQGGELQVIKSVTKLEIKKGSIPTDYGILVNNIGTLWAIYHAIFEGRPTIERVITVSGNGCEYVGNYLVKVGTPVIHILRETNNSWNPDKHTIVLGGAMMGKAVESPMVPVHKGAGGLLILRKKEIVANNCIKCGLCVDVCPQKLMPLEFVRHNLLQDVLSLKNFHLQDCIECGACAYICPSDVSLMENIFEGKAKVSQHV